MTELLLTAHGREAIDAEIKRDWTLQPEDANGDVIAVKPDGSKVLVVTRYAQTLAIGRGATAHLTAAYFRRWTRSEQDRVKDLLVRDVWKKGTVTK